MRKCWTCKVEKEDISFSSSQLKKNKRKCRACVSLYDQAYYQKNREKKLDSRRVYRQENTEKINETNKKHQKKKRKNDPIFRSHEQISAAIRNHIASHGGSKNGAETADFLLWTWEEYIMHMETRFSHPDNLTPDGKVWMTWKNQGVFRTDTWDDNDPKTWKWQRDHIIPHSTFHYTSMDCPEFRDCWALSNLRPYSAKQNVLDGVTRIRHQDIGIKSNNQDMLLENEG